MFSTNSDGMKVTHAVLYDASPGSDFNPLGFIFDAAGEVSEVLKLAKNPEWDEDDESKGAGA